MPDTPAPQPDNCELARTGAIALGDTLIACSRSLVDETLRDAEVFASADLVDQGNIRPLIPLAIDPPDHKRYRRLLDPLFAPRQIDRLEDDITMRVNHFIDGSSTVASATSPRSWPSCSPRRCSSDCSGRVGGARHPGRAARRDPRPGTATSEPAERTRIQKETAGRVYDYFDAVLDNRVAAPQNDILSLLTTAELGDERLTRHEMLDICFVLLTAGLDTVTDSLTCFWAFLAQHPDHQRQLVEHPEVIPDAVEELLRWESPVPAVIRWARQDHLVGDHPVGAGHLVMANLSSANVDPDLYDDPLEVRFDREVNRHLAFGGGIHRCLGSHLARRELRIALARVAPTHPGLLAGARLHPGLPATPSVRTRSAARLVELIQPDLTPPAPAPGEPDTRRTT